MYLKVLELPLNVMKLSGVNPSQNTWIAKILSALALISGATTFVTAIIEMCYVERTIVTFAPAAETFFASLEVNFQRLFFFCFLLFSSIYKACSLTMQQTKIIRFLVFTKSGYTLNF